MYVCIYIYIHTRTTLMEVITFLNFVELHFGAVSACPAAKMLFMDLAIYIYIYIYMFLYIHI